MLWSYIELNIKGITNEDLEIAIGLWSEYGLGGIDAMNDALWVVPATRHGKYRSPSVALSE